MKLAVTREYYLRFETMCATLKLQALERAHLLRDNKENGIVPPICDLCSKLPREQRQAIEKMMKVMASHTGRTR